MSHRQRLMEFVITSRPVVWGSHIAMAGVLAVAVAVIILTKDDRRPF